MADRNPDTLPTSYDPSGPCPNCGRVSNFTHESNFHMHHDLSGAAPRQYVAQFLRCMGCDRYTFTLELEAHDGRPNEAVFWWPTPGADALDDSVPEKVSDAYREGVRCLAIQAPNAAVTMLRNALAQIVQDKGSEDAKKKRTLNDAIVQMVADRTLWETFGEWAHRVRQMGNAGAHQETFSDVTQEEAEQVRSLAGAIIDFLYVQHAKVTAALPPAKRAP